MRSVLYEVAAFALLIGSALAYYECVTFLADQNYIAGWVTVAIGFSLVRAGVDMSRLAAATRRGE